MKKAALNNFNISGLCKVFFTLAANVKKISLPDQFHQVTVELKPGFDWDEIYFTRTAEDVQINQIDDESGTWYRVQAKLINPRLTPEKAATFAALEMRDLVFWLQDNNQVDMLVGSPAMPAKLNYQLSNPGKGRNERVVTISAYHDREPFYIEATVVNPGGAFSDGFSEGFHI